MILCDSNVWVALAISHHTFHLAAQHWFSRISTPRTLCFCRATQQSFLRLLTSAAMLAPYGSQPLTNRQAWNHYQALLADDRIEFQHREPQGIEHYWEQFATRDSASPKLWMDAYLAAFAIAGGYQLVTTDKAFSQFDGLDHVILTRQNFRTDES